MGDFEDAFPTFGEMLDERTEAMSAALSSLAETVSDALTAFQPAPLAEASALKDLSREHDLDVVERNSVRVERDDGALRATYHDGDGWQPVTRYSLNCRCSPEVARDD